MDDYSTVSSKKGHQAVVLWLGIGINVLFGSFVFFSSQIRDFHFRVIIKNKDFSEIIFSRIKPFLDDIEIKGDPQKIHIHGIRNLMQGTWKPVSLNHVGQCNIYILSVHI